MACPVSGADVAMMWISDAVEPSRRAAYVQVQVEANWTEWHPFPEAIADAPRLPGVYLLREPAAGVIRYIGMAVNVPAVAEHRGCEGD